MLEYTVQFALCVVHYTVLRRSTGDLQFARPNVCYNVLQCCKVLCNVHCSRYIAKYCSAAKWFEICTLQAILLQHSWFAACTVTSAAVQHFDMYMSYRWRESFNTVRSPSDSWRHHNGDWHVWAQNAERRRGMDHTSVAPLTNQLCSDRGVVRVFEYNINVLYYKYGRNQSWRY